MCVCVCTIYCFPEYVCVCVGDPNVSLSVPLHIFSLCMFMSKVISAFTAASEGSPLLFY